MSSDNKPSSDEQDMVLGELEYWTEAIVRNYLANDEIEARIYTHDGLRIKAIIKRLNQALLLCWFKDNTL